MNKDGEPQVQERDNAEADITMQALHHNLTERYNRLENQLKQERQVHDRLAGQLAVCRERKRHSSYNEEYKDLIKRKTRESVLLLDKQNESDMRALVEIYDRKRQERERAIAEANARYNRIKGLLDELADGLAEGLERAEDTLQSRNKVPVTGAGAIETSSSTEWEKDRMLKHYIEGNAAGEDLYDQGGDLIIRKEARITSEAVDRAERAGLLHQLILTMIGP